MFEASGFAIRKSRASVEASDGTTTIILDSVPVALVGLRRVVFDLNAPAGTAHVGRTGRSTLVVGPGKHAMWAFEEPA